MEPSVEMAKRRGDLSRLCQNGFPIIDSLYWEHPSPKVGGWFVLQLHQADPPARGTFVDLRYPTHASRRLAQVIEVLNKEHQPNYWYRGQRVRRECVYRGTVPAIDRFRRGLTPIEAILEALAPSAFRHITENKPANWSEFTLVPPTDYLAGPMRAIMANDEPALHHLLLQCLDWMVFEAARLALSDKVKLGYDDNLLAVGTTLARHSLDLISISQHYEYGSIMIDVSKDVDTAVWFATRDWKTGEITKSSDGSPGVIYRFDAQKIKTMMDQSVNGPGAMAPLLVQTLGVFGLADISNSFNFLGRPQAQKGGSLLGMENILTHFLIGMQRAAEVFLFDHDSVHGNEISLARGNICPPHDKGHEIFRPDRKYPATPITPDELDQFLRKMGTESADRVRLVEHRRNYVI